jgi:hypothetical protein
MTNRLRTFRATASGFALAHVDLAIATLAFIVVLGVYVRTLAPSVAEVFDDTLEMQLVAIRMGIAHPTGYPFYSILASLFASLIPIGNAAYRVNLLSAVAGALVAPALYFVARRFACGRRAALAAALLFVFSPVFWSQSVVAEVYSLNALFVAGALLLTLNAGLALRLIAPSPGTLGKTDPVDGASPQIIMLSAFLGLSLTHHRTMVLLLPALAAYLWMQAGGLVVIRRLPFRRILAAFALPLLLYLYIPIRGLVTGSIDGTYQNTLSGFVQWIAGTPYLSFLSENALQQDTRTPAFFAGVFFGQFGAVAVALAVLGALWLLFQGRREFVLLLLAFGSQAVFVLSYRVSDIEVFYLPTFMLFCICAGCGISALFNRARRLAANDSRSGVSGAAATALRWTLMLAGLAAAVLLPLNMLRASFFQEDQSANWTAQEYALEILRQPTEQGATVVGILGEMTLLRYFQETDGLRTDLVLVAADREQDRLNAVDRATKSGSPVYLTRPLSGIEARQSLASFGPLIKVLPAPLTQPPAIRFPRLVDFGGQASLLGYSLNEAPGVFPAASQRTASSRQGLEPRPPASGVEAGQRLRVTLYWQASKKTDENAKISLRLVDPSGRQVAQQDGMPIYDAYPTSAWRPGEVIVDTHYLPVPLGAVPGDYRITLSLYSPSRPDGIQAFDGSVLENHVNLGQVTVARPVKPPSLDGLPARPSEKSGGPGLPGWTEVESLASLGVHHVVRGNFDNQITLFGFGLSRDPLKPGEGVDVTLLWRAERDIDTSYVVFLQVVDGDGKVWASSDSPPLAGNYPTSRWIRGEIVRDTHTLVLPANMPNGDYGIQLGLYRSQESGKERLTVLRWTTRSSDALDLGSATIKGRDRTYMAPVVPRAQPVRFGAGIRLLGYGIVKEANPGGGATVRLTLYFQALTTMDRSYTVFTHLLDSQSRIWAQEDAMPLRGAAPTTTWLAGESITDEFVLSTKPGAPPGDYDLEIGFYDSGSLQRLTVFSDAGATLGDHLLLQDRIKVGP